MPVKTPRRRRAAAADVAAFEQVYRRRHRRVHGVVARLVGQASARAEDLTEEAFARAWQALLGFRFDSAVSTWVHRLAVNTALMELRARRSRPLQDDDENALGALSTPDTAGYAVLGRDLERAVAPQRHPSTPPANKRERPPACTGRQDPARGVRVSFELQCTLWAGRGRDPTGHVLGRCRAALALSRARSRNNDKGRIEDAAFIMEVRHARRSR